MRLSFTSAVPADISRIKAGFTRDLFLALAPPWARVRLERFDGCRTGDEVHLRIKIGTMTGSWVSLITEEKSTSDEWVFVDEGKVLPWPLTKWRHVHRVQREALGKSLIFDEIEFSCANALLERLCLPGLWASFAVRPRRYRKFFTRISP